jgi:hypothetical protein
MSSSSLGHAKQGKKKKIFSFVPPPGLSKKDANNPLACHVVEEGRGHTPWEVRGGSTVAAPATSPSPVFAYKNRGRGRKTEQGREGRERPKDREQMKKREGQRDERETEQRREEKRREEKRREEKERKRKKKQTAKEEENTEEEGGETAGHRAFAATPGKPSAIFILPSLLPSPRKTCTVHVCRRGEADYCAHAQ